MLGGIAGGRPLYDLPFEQALNRVLGKRIIDDDSFASAVWSALSNVTWQHSSGMEVSYSFRAAGDLIPAIPGGHAPAAAAIIYSGIVVEYLQ